MGLWGHKQMLSCPLRPRGCTGLWRAGWGVKQEDEQLIRCPWGAYQPVGKGDTGLGEDSDGRTGNSVMAASEPPSHGGFPVHPSMRSAMILHLNEESLAVSFPQ